MTSVPARMPAATAARPASRVERGHRRDRLLRHLAGRLHPAVEHADAERLGQRQRRAGDRGVVADQPVEVDQPGDGHAVLRLGVVDRVAAADVAAGLLRHLEPAAQHLGGELGRAARRAASRAGSPRRPGCRPWRRRRRARWPPRSGRSRRRRRRPGVKKSVVSTRPWPPAIRTTAASSPSSRPTTSSAFGRRRGRCRSARRRRPPARRAGSCRRSRRRGRTG